MNTKIQRQELDDLEAILGLVETVSKQIAILTENIEGDAGQLWDELVPVWERRREIKMMAKKRLIDRYNYKAKKLKL